MSQSLNNSIVTASATAAQGTAARLQDLYKDFSTPEDARKVVKLKAFSKFDNTTEALAAAAALVDSKLSKGACMQQHILTCGCRQAAAAAANFTLFPTQICTWTVHWRRAKEVFEEEC